MKFQSTCAYKISQNLTTKQNFISKTRIFFNVKTAMKFWSHEHRHTSEPFRLVPKIIDGCVGGALGVTIIYPIDLAKTRLQNQRTKYYRGIFDCLWKTYRSEGFLKMYKGCAMNAALMAPETAIKMTVNDFCRRKLSEDDGSISIIKEIIAGASAGICQSVVSTPMELIKIQLQDHGRTGGSIRNIFTGAVSHSSPSSRSVIRDILKTGGIFSLYKGSFPTLIRNCVFAIIFFPLVANINPHPRCEHFDLNFLWTLSAGVVSGSTAAAITTPLDVVKTRIQTLQKGMGEDTYNGVGDAFHRIVKSEGVFALFRGLVSRSLIIGSILGISQMVYFSDFAEHIFYRE